MHGMFVKETYKNVFYWYLLQVSGFSWRCFWNAVFCFE